MRAPLFFSLGFIVSLCSPLSLVAAASSEETRSGLVEPDLRSGAVLSYAEHDYEKTLASALENRQMVLVEFTGSDWCPPCKRLKKLILNTPEFAEYLKVHNLRFVELDFPRTAGKISKEQMKKQEAIMNRLRVSGFPSVVLVDGNGLPYKKIVGIEKTPEAYVKHLTAGLELKKAFDKAVETAFAQSGRKRAEALVDALELLPSEFRANQDVIIAEIIANDEADEFGFGKKLNSETLLAKQRVLVDEFFKKCAGRVGEENLTETRMEAEKLLKSIPKIQPEIARELNKFISDNYAMIHDFENSLRYLKAAHESDPDSRAGKALLPWIKNMENIIKLEAESAK